MQFLGGKGPDKNLTQSVGRHGAGVPQGIHVLVPRDGAVGEAGAPQGVLTSCELPPKTHAIKIPVHVDAGPSRESSVRRTRSADPIGVSGNLFSSPN